MKLEFRLLITLCLSLTSFRSMAMANNYVSVVCGQKHVLIKSGYAEGVPPLDKPTDFYLQNYGQTNECRLKSGDTVRVRLGFEFYGERHAQVSWVSVWFDRKKWISRTSVEVNGLDDARADEIDISADGIRVCTVHGPIGGSDEGDGDGKKQKPVCKFVARSDLSNVIDTHESERFDPSNNPLVPPTILLGREDTLCKTMTALNKDTSRSGVELVEHLWLNFPTGQSIRIDPSPDSTGQEWAVSDKFDIDNGGGIRHVYHRLQSMGYWENYDIYVVLNNAGYQRFLLTAMTDKDLLENAESVWPMDWSGHGHRLATGKIVGSLAVSLSISKNSSEKEDIPLNQLKITPFSYKDQTYLLLSSNQSSDGLGLVVNPHPAGAFDQRCVFRAGVTNF